MLLLRVGLCTCYCILIQQLQLCMQFNHFTMLSEVLIMCEFVIHFFVYLNNLLWILKFTI